MFQSRLANAENAYYKSIGVDMTNSTAPQEDTNTKVDKLLDYVTLVTCNHKYKFNVEIHW